jgi:predicted transcriptional regulator
MPRKQNLRRPRSSRPAHPNGPSQLKTNIEHTHQFRFLSSSGATTIITDSTLQNALGVSASTAVVGHPIRQSLRVLQVEIWSPPASQGAAVTCSVLWPSSQRSQAREVTDTSNSVTTPAHVKCGPPSESLAAFWTDGTSGATFFSLTAPPGSIIDVWCSMVDVDGGYAGNANTSVLVGATVGLVYYCALDSSTKAAAIYLPIGLTSV